jgi:hypothetical protein
MALIENSRRLYREECGIRPEENNILARGFFQLALGEF